LGIVAKGDEPELAEVAEGNSLLALSLDLERRPAAIIGLDGRVAVANSAMIVALHRSRQDFRGLRGDALFAPECRAEVRRNIELGRPGHELVFETTCVSDARPPSGESALKGAVLWRGSEDAISSTTPVVQAGAES
jgi:hypothetical protein